MSQAFARFLKDEEQAPEEFLDEHVAEVLRKRVGEEPLVERIETIRGELLGATLDDLYPDGPNRAGLLFLSPSAGEQAVLIRLSAKTPHAIEDIWFEGGFHLDPDAEVEVLPPPLTWDNLEERMRLEVEAGFSGALILTRDGKVIVNEGYGLANREKGYPCTSDTIFATGSVPIDYTKAGILILAQDGAIDLGQPITDFFDGVPKDKQGITIQHLMTGQSGLLDFHGLPTDADPDHHWIDRDEAARRILAQGLLFEPGKGRQHSHSAWGLLAAIIEIASEMTYQDFTRKLLFEPAGMKDTGFNGDPVPEERLAIGYGFMSDGEINAPPYWGQTSWLVMGSGGMISTTGDMLRWQEALRRGDILSPEWTTRYWSGPGVFAAGDMFGYEVNYTETPDPQFVLLSSSIDGTMRRRFNRLGREIGRLR